MPLPCERTIGRWLILATRLWFLTEDHFSETWILLNNSIQNNCYPAMLLQLLGCNVMQRLHHFLSDHPQGSKRKKLDKVAMVESVGLYQVHTPQNKEILIITLVLRGAHGRCHLRLSWKLTGLWQLASGFRRYINQICLLPAHRRTTLFRQYIVKRLAKWKNYRHERMMRESHHICADIDVREIATVCNKPIMLA